MHTMLSYLYPSEEELIKTQKNLIELGMHCLQFSEYVDFDEREYYYHILQLLYKRGELDIG